MRLLGTLPVLACSALLLTACGGQDTATPAASTGTSSASGAAFAPGQDVEVTAGDATCEVAHTRLQPGRHSFEVRNSGGKVTEVYVYGKGGSGAFDKVVAEVENVAPALKRDFAAQLAPGEYELACKPGQTGDGIRTTLTVVGDTPAAPAEAAYDREVEVVVRDGVCTGMVTTAKTGEKIEFKLENAAAAPYELELFGPDGAPAGEVSTVQPGATGEAVVTLATAGTWTYRCGAPGTTDGERGTFTVA